MAAQEAVLNPIPKQHTFQCRDGSGNLQINAQGDREGRCPYTINPLNTSLCCCGRTRIPTHHAGGGGTGAARSHPCAGDSVALLV